ncbi:hypothetical protein E2C01_035881 [Portunus trituberculatus]|uniref:Uncharacterized protein n=1 Tax=Portunus trituberculatus TaxID=210409 RepID=A0A5B7F9K2_PORTR|nr:hypothetical protein [Portunus trituberculatus]
METGIKARMQEERQARRHANREKGKQASREADVNRYKQEERQEAGRQVNIERKAGKEADK